MAEETFNDFTKQARIEFVNYINSLEWNNELRTKCEDLLIAYDQMKAKCDGMDETSELNNKALRLQNVVPSTLDRPSGLEDDEWYCPNCKCVVPPHEVTNDERHGIKGCLAKVN